MVAPELLTAQYLAASVERLLTSAGGFNLPASALQRAICRVIDGTALGALEDRPEVMRAFGGALPVPRPRELTVFSGVRVGKSMIAGATAVTWSQRIDVSHLRAGETPRIAIVSTRMDNAEVVFDHIVGALQGSAQLRALLVEEPRNERILVRHPSGRPVEILVVAGSRAGASLVSRWLGGVIFDEFPRMVGADDGVINWDDQRRAVVQRILRGGGILNIGSPWAPFGPAYQMFVEHFGKPDNSLCVVKAPASDMHPKWWTPERCADAKALDPDAYITDVLAEFASLEESLFTGVELDRATRAEPYELEPQSDHHYVAAMDPATRSNSWTLVIATREGARKRVALARQWTGSRLEPLSPREVFASMAPVLRRYRVATVWTDQYYVDALRDLALEHGIQLVQIEMTEREKVEKWRALQVRVAIGEVELSRDPVFRADMQRVKKKTTQTGLSIVLPRTSDGRHCDYAPATLLALHRYLDDAAAPPLTVDEALRAEQEKMRADAIKRWGKRKSW